MTRYPHFAFPHLYLLNGYKEFRTTRGLEREYVREDDLEQCIRRLVLRKADRLTGWDSRFLRRGLELSQSEFGSLVDRDAQTVARWEKSGDPIPRAVDLCLRIRYAARFEPNVSITEVLSYVDGVAPRLPESIYLRLTEQGWTFEQEPTVKYARSMAAGKANVRLLGPLAPLRCALFQDSTSEQVNLTLMVHRDEDGALLVADVPGDTSVQDAIAALQRPQQGLKLTITGSANDDASATIH